VLPGNNPVPGFFRNPDYQEAGKNRGMTEYPGPTNAGIPATYRFRAAFIKIIFINYV
jgi:hypothetical protein